MKRESSNLDPSSNEARDNRWRRDALEVLLEARERLITQMADEIRAQREVLLEGGGESLFSFEFQEIEDRYSARLHSLNSILENLEYRRPRLAHKVETLKTTQANLDTELNALISQYDQWDLVNVSVNPIGEALLVVVVFTADEYSE